jgi:3-deoxy-D-manno-octulosonic-acid transferase
MLQIDAWIGDTAARDAVAGRGRRYVDELGGALDRTLAALDPYFTRLRAVSLSSPA